MAGLRITALALSPTSYYTLDGDGTDLGSDGNDLSETGTVDFAATEYETNSGAMDVDNDHTIYLSSSTPWITSSDTDFTMMALVRVANHSLTQLAGGSGHNDLSSGGGAFFVHTSSNKLRFQIGGSANEWSTTPTDDTYYLLVGRMDHSELDQDFWVNGTKMTTVNIGGGNNVDASAEAKIGGQIKSLSQSAREWQGAIDEWAVWDGVALSDAQIDSLWTALNTEGVGPTVESGGGGSFYEIGSGMPGHMMRRRGRT